MLKRKITKNKALIIISCFLIIVGISLFTIPFFIKEKINEEEQNNIQEFFEEEIEDNGDGNVEISNKQSTNNILYSMIIEIPKINLKKGLYDKESKYNKVNYNIQIMNESDMPNIVNGNLILAGHNGNSNIAYFNKLDKLQINDLIYIYYENNKYIYQLVNVYEEDKDGSIVIHRDNDETIIALITCKKNSKDKQLVYIGNLISKEAY